jgi:hypothetical protein
MVPFNKFQSFPAALAAKQHNLATDTLKVMLTNTAPVVTAAAKGDIAEIAGGNGYTAGGLPGTVTGATQTAGIFTLKVADVTVVASGGPVGPFQYAVLYNATSGLLIGWWAYGSSVTLNSADSFTVDFDDANGVLSLQ